MGERYDPAISEAQDAEKSSRRIRYDQILLDYSDPKNGGSRRMARRLRGLSPGQQKESEVSEWQPIETAPKDGTKIDVWVREFSFGVGGAVSIKDIGRVPNAWWGQEVHHYTNPYEAETGVTGWVYPGGRAR